MKHVAFECKCYRTGCMFCDGGLFECINCHSFEGATTTDCVGVLMTADQIDQVYAGEIDFVDGKWVNQASQHTPAYYRKASK